jgi:cytidylate kinase
MDTAFRITAHSPLMRARDAIVVDTSNMTIEGQVEHIIELVMELIKK